MSEPVSRPLDRHVRDLEQRCQDLEQQLKIWQEFADELLPMLESSTGVLEQAANIVVPRPPHPPFRPFESWGDVRVRVADMSRTMAAVRQRQALLVPEGP